MQAMHINVQPIESNAILRGLLDGALKSLKVIVIVLSLVPYMEHENDLSL